MSTNSLPTTSIRITNGSELISSISPNSTQHSVPAVDGVSYDINVTVVNDAGNSNPVNNRGGK